MVQIREFDVAVASVEQSEEDWTEFAINERDAEGEIVRVVKCRAQKPAPGQAMYVMAAMGRGSNSSDKIAGVINLLGDICDDKTREYIERRLLDRYDRQFEFEQVIGIIEGLLEEWGGFPTRQPSDYAPSQKPGGRKSTRRTPALT